MGPALGIAFQLALFSVEVNLHRVKISERMCLKNRILRPAPQDWKFEVKGAPRKRLSSQRPQNSSSTELGDLLPCWALACFIITA